MLDSYRDLIDGLLPTPMTLRNALGQPVPETVPDETAAALEELRVREAVNLRRMQAAMRREPVMLLAMEDEPEIAALSSTPTTTPEEAMESFSHDRSELISILVNLTVRDWDREINHDRSGDTTIAEEIEDHLTWDESMVERLTAS